MTSHSFNIHVELPFSGLIKPDVVFTSLKKSFSLRFDPKMFSSLDIYGFDFVFQGKWFIFVAVSEKQEKFIYTRLKIADILVSFP